MYKRIFIVLMLVLPLELFADENLVKSRIFIEDLGKQVLTKVASPSISNDQRKNNFKMIYENAFDNAYISRFVLGRHWKKIDEQIKRDFIKSFNDYLIMVYAPKFKGWKGEFKTLNSELKNNMYIVAMNLVTKDSSSLKLDWRLYVNKNKNFKILDVNIDGVSMLVTQRAEFASVIKNSPQGVKGLIEKMKEKLNL